MLYGSKELILILLETNTGIMVLWGGVGGVSIFEKYTQKYLHVKGHKGQDLL